MSVVFNNTDGSVKLKTHNETVFHSFKRGDLIEFHRHRGVYSHWAVYIGDGLVVHLTGEGNDGVNAKKRPDYLFTISGKTFDKARVCKEEFWNVVLGSKFSVNNNRDKKWRARDPEEIVKNALSREGQVGYSLATQNCEHFAKWCRYGVEKSDQVSKVVKGVSLGIAVTAAVVGVVAGIATLLGSSGQSGQSDDEDDD